MMRYLVSVCAAIFLAITPLSASIGKVSSAFQTCAGADSWVLIFVDSTDETDCDFTPSGTADALCMCLNGTVTALAAGGGGGGAPTTLDYFVGSPTGSLSAERVGTDTASIDVDLGTAGQVKFNVITPVASASDLSGCTNCIGGAEVDESTLGAVPTATAFATNPADCNVGEYAFRIAANGDLSCDVPTGSGLSHPQVMARLAVGGGF